MRPILRFASILCAALVTPAIALENIPSAVVGHLNRQGPIVLSKFIRDGYSMVQIAAYNCVDENLKGGKNEGANNAANTHCAVALFNRKGSGRWTFGGEVDLGQGDIENFTSGVVLAESVTYADDDPLSTPSRRLKIRLSTAGGKLVQIRD